MACVDLKSHDYVNDDDRLPASTGVVHPALCSSATRRSGGDLVGAPPLSGGARPRDWRGTSPQRRCRRPPAQADPGPQPEEYYGEYPACLQHVQHPVRRPLAADEVRWDPAERVLDAAALEADVLYRPTVFPLPPFAVRLVWGDMGEEFLLGGQCGGPERLLGEKSSIAHPELGPGLEHVLRR